MTSSYGYQRPLSNEEQLYLQNQVLRAELQRREGEQNALDAVAKTALTVGGLALGAAGARNLLRRGKTPVSTRGVTVTDLGSIPTEDVRRASTTSARTVEVATSPRPAPSQPAPKTYSERLARNEEFTRQALAERPQPVRQGNLSELVKQINVQDLGPVEQKRLPAAKEFLEQRLTGQKTDLPTARTPGTFQEFSREASGVAAAERLAQDPELLSLVKAQEAQELSEARSFQAKAQAEYRRLITEEGEQVRADLLAGQRDALAKTENTIQSAAQSDFGPQSFLQSEGYVATDNLVDQYQARALGRIDQFANAANPAEDQATGRVKMALQRNEDVNLAAVEMAEDTVDTQIAKAAQGDPTVASVTELDSAINQAASTLPDGLPVDQAERLNIRTQGIDLRTGERFALSPERPYRGGLQPGMQLETEAQAPSKGMEAAQKFLTTEREEIASQLGEQGFPATASRVEAELANRLSGPKAWEYGPEYTQRKQALQLGATYDPDLLESVATGVKPAGEVTIAGEAVPVSSLREPVVMEETAQRLQERVAEKKDWLGNIRLEEQSNQNRISRELDKLSTRDQVVSDYINYVESEFPRKTFYSSPYERDITAKKQYEAEGARIEQEQISNQMESLLQQAGKSQRRVAGAERSTQEQISNLQVPEKLKTGIEEGQRIYFEQDPVTGAPIPGTQELRSERYAIETEAKRGGGRRAVEYDPLGQSGQAKDVYGTRLATELSDDPTRRPTKTGPSRQPLTQPVTPQGLRGVDVTRDIMRIEKSAPPEKAKQLVAEYISKLQG